MAGIVFTGMARALASASTGTPDELVDVWADQTLTLRLVGVGQMRPDIGGHLRRSFLGALGSAASSEAQTGRPCPWDPPCALDVFCREQLRGPKGDGLPKPYVIATWPEGRDLVVTLRIFGMANDWAMAAFEAMVAGIRTILPWSKLAPGLSTPPQISARNIELFRFAVLPPPPDAARLIFLSPMDASGTDPVTAPHTILARALRRVDALGRWSGVALEPDTGAALATRLRRLDYDVSALRPGTYHSPNRHRQNRQDPSLSGQLVLRGDLTGLWPLLQIAERSHIGRHAVEGLGRIRLEPLAQGAALGM